MQDFGGDLAAVLGGLAQLVLRLLVDATAAAAAVGTDGAKTAAQRVLVPRLELLSEVADLA